MSAPYRLDESLRARITRNVAEFPNRNNLDASLKHAAVALVVVGNETGEGALILTRRAARLNAHAGQWALPGGRLDAGETPVNAALREMREEIGLDVAPENVVGLLDDYPTRSGYLITPVVVWAGGDTTLTPNPDEVASIHYISFRELTRPDSPVFISIPESERPVIRMLMMDDYVHAPTAAVMHQFGEVCLMGRHTRVDHYEQPVFAWK